MITVLNNYELLIEKYKPSAALNFEISEQKLQLIRKKNVGTECVHDLIRPGMCDIDSTQGLGITGAECTLGLSITARSNRHSAPGPHNSWHATGNYR